MLAEVWTIDHPIESVEAEKNRLFSQKKLFIFLIKTHRLHWHGWLDRALGTRVWKMNFL